LTLHSSQSPHRPPRPPLCSKNSLAHYHATGSTSTLLKFESINQLALQGAGRLGLQLREDVEGVEVDASDGDAVSVHLGGVRRYVGAAAGTLQLPALEAVLPIRFRIRKDPYLFKGSVSVYKVWILIWIKKRIRIIIK